jgi:hypothetical protein
MKTGEQDGTYDGGQRSSLNSGFPLRRAWPRRSLNKMKLASRISSLLLLLCSSAVWGYNPSPQFKNGVCVLCRDTVYSRAYKNDYVYLAIDKTGKILTEEVASSSYLSRNETLSETEIKLKDGSAFETRDDKLVPSEKKVVIEGGEYQPAGVWDYIVFEEGGKKGLKGFPSKEVIIKPEFDDLSGTRMWKKQGWLQPHSDTKCIGVKKDGKWGVLNIETKKIVVPIRYDSVDLAGQNAHAVLKGKEWGYYSKASGEEVANGFILALAFAEGKAIAFRDQEVATVIDESGKEIFQFKCDYPENNEDRAITIGAGGLAYKEGLIVVRNKGKFGILNEKGEEVQAFEYDQIGGYRDGAFRDGMARFVKGGKVGFFNSAGKIAVKATWDDSGVFSEGLAYVIAGDRWGFIDKSGKVVIGPHDFPEAEPKPKKSEERTRRR